MFALRTWANFISHCDHRGAIFHNFPKGNYFTSGVAEYFTFKNPALYANRLTADRLCAILNSIIRKAGDMKMNNLFEEWQKRHFDKGFQYFNRDGIVNQRIWDSQKVKICFFILMLNILSNICRIKMRKVI